MRIAVSGTHSVDKSTFVWDFIHAHPEYIREEEPYRVLREHYNIKFGKASTRYCNGIQLYYNLSRVKQYPLPSSNVLFDRSPVDYLAYSLYTAQHHQTQRFAYAAMESSTILIPTACPRVNCSPRSSHAISTVANGITAVDNEAIRPSTFWQPKDQKT